MAPSWRILTKVQYVVSRNYPLGLPDLWLVSFRLILVVFTMERFLQTTRVLSSLIQHQ